MEIDNVRKLLVSKLADDLLRSETYVQLEKKVLQIACQTDQDLAEDQDDLVELIQEKLIGEDLHTNFLNDIYGLLYGYAGSKLSDDEYIPDEPDWIISGRIKWLKRVSKGLDQGLK